MSARPKASQHLIPLLFLCVALTAQGANSQDIYSRVQPSVVFLTAEARERGTNKVLSAERSGAIVSSAGLVLTTYDLISSFTDAQPGSIKIKTIDPSGSGPTVRLAILEYSQHLKLLLLALPTGDYKHFTISPKDALAPGEKIFFSGYRGENMYYYNAGEPPGASTTIEDEVSLGKIAVKQATGPSVSLDGGPVYNARGELLGILNGSSDSEVITYSRVPYAAQLLNVIRTDTVMATIDTRLPERRANELEAALRELRTSTTFDCDVSIRDGAFRIIYDKMLASPAVKEMRLRITGILPGPPFETESFPDEVGFSLTSRTPDSVDQTKGWFDASTDGLATVTSLMTLYKVTDVKFNISAELDDGQMRADGSLGEGTKISFEQVKGVGELR